MGTLFPRSPSSLTSIERTKRDVALGLKRLPLVNWLYGSRDVNHLLLVPRDLRTADPSFSIEMDMGQFGLAGATVLLEGRSPFFVDPPNKAWSRELHGFGWVRNLRAARSDRAQQQAIELLEHWLKNFTSQKGLSWEAGVVARRLISWFSYSNFLLQEADEQLYMDLMIAIDDHMKFLSMVGTHAEAGMPRLLSLIALVYAGLCVANQERFLDQQLKLLCLELDRQILSDGGHISRDNSVLASILLDLLPLKQCFVTRKMDVPGALNDAIQRMLPMINYMRLGDGLLSRFNGAGTTLPDTLGTAMAYDDVSSVPLKQASASRYFRLEKGNVIVLMDGGSPPPLTLSHKAHAGCLSFEMSSGTCPLIVNCGAAPPAFYTMAHNARASVCHSTLTVNNRSSAHFLHDERLQSSETPSLLEGPGHVHAQYETKGDQHKIVASHDGYLEQFGLVHHRLLSLSNDGYTLIGEDWIELPDGHDVIQRGLGWPFAIHFHIHPDVMVTRAGDGKSVRLTLPDSQVWTFRANDTVIYLEESIFYADFAGPCQSVQIVIRGNCLGPLSVPWKLSKEISNNVPDPGKVPAWLSGNVIPLDAGGDEIGREENDDEAVSQTLSPDLDKDGDKDTITDLVEDIPVKIIEKAPEDVEDGGAKASPSKDKSGKKPRRRRRSKAVSHFSKLKPVEQQPADKTSVMPPPPPGKVSDEFGKSPVDDKMSKDPASLKPVIEDPAGHRPPPPPSKTSFETRFTEASVSKSEKKWTTRSPSENKAKSGSRAPLDKKTVLENSPGPDRESKPEGKGPDKTGPDAKARHNKNKRDELGPSDN